MLSLPPPDPNECQEPRGLELDAPTAIFLGGSPSPEANRLADTVLAWRPGALIIAASR
jgi:hypothetical protein